LFVLLTVFAIWLGVVVNHAREQRDAVQAIEAMGGSVRYDWQPDLVRAEGMGAASDQFVMPLADSNPRPAGPAWLRRLIGDDYFQHVERVYIIHPKADLLKSIPYLQQLRRVRRLTILASVPESTRNQLKAALPDCEIRLSR
jgi:hypothetical protein